MFHLAFILKVHFNWKQLTQIKDEPVVVETAPPFEEEEWKYDIVDPTEVYV